MKFTVQTADLRRALQAVMPHVSTDPELPMIHRVRITVEEHIATIAGTDRFTMGMAVVSVIAHDADPIYGMDLGTFDLPPGDVAKILHLFRVGKGPEEQFLVQFDCTDDERVAVRDVSGLDILGDALDMPRIPFDDATPDLRQAFANWLSRDPAVLEDLSIAGAKVSRFKSASTAYGQPLILRRPHQAPLLIQCGPDFLGALASMRFNEDDQQDAKSVRVAWEHRLPAPQGVIRIDETYAAQQTSDEETTSDDDD